MYTLVYDACPPTSLLVYLFNMWPACKHRDLPTTFNYMFLSILKHSLPKKETRAGFKGISAHRIWLVFWLSTFHNFKSAKDVLLNYIGKSIRKQINVYRTLLSRVDNGSTLAFIVNVNQEKYHFLNNMCNLCPVFTAPVFVLVKTNSIWSCNRFTEFPRNCYLHQRRRLPSGGRTGGRNTQLLLGWKRNWPRKRPRCREVKQQKMMSIGMWLCAQ